MEDGRGQAFLALWFNFVAGDLFGDEAVERLVAVQGLDDVVTIKRPGIGDRPVVLVAFGFRIADHVEPVLSPSFAILATRQQPVDNFFAGVGRSVVQEFLDIVRSGWKTGQIERDPPNQFDLPRRSCERQIVSSFERLQNERIDGRRDLSTALNGRRR